MSLWKKPKGLAMAPTTIRVETKGKNGDVIETKPKGKALKPTKTTPTSGLDSDIEALQNSLAAAAGQKKEYGSDILQPDGSEANSQFRAKVIDTLPSSKKGGAKNKGKLLSSMASYGPSNARSLPSSPALNAIGSPSLNPTISASQQAMEKAKEQRIPLVHELAVQEYPFSYLEGKWSGNSDDFKASLEKVADFMQGSQKWALKKIYWKELDVWNYDYDSEDDRQKAIDNAIRQFDRMRLAASEPEWQKLLPREERGKGKCLSRLQANIAKAAVAAAAPAPKIKVQKAEDASSESGKEEGSQVKPKAESMTRSISQPLPAKGKKATSAAADKRLLTATKKTTTTKTSPNKGGAKGKDKGGRILSSEFITNSDTSEDEALAVTSIAAKSRPPPPAPVQKAKEVVTVKPKPAPKPTPKPAPKPAAKPASVPAKRSREDDDGDSSSSGTPLANKRIKQKPTIKAPMSLKHRPSDASQNSRGTSSGISLKSKNTSPAKSSPLASSPPTNASDLDQPEERTITLSKAPPTMTAKVKRRAAEAENEIKAKRQRLTQDLVTKATKFKLFYQKYEALHWEISALEHPPEDKMADLLDMRARLKFMKNEIYRECPPARG
jgi:RNA polymerase II elongation factor ELL